MNIIVKVGFLAILSTLLACERHKIETTLEQRFDAYLEVKRLKSLDEKSRSVAWEKFKQREHLADSIENGNYLNAALIDAEINQVRKEILISRYFDKFLSEKVTDEQVINYYNTHVNDYESLKANVAHILIRTHKGMSENERLAKLTIAQEAYSKLRANADFSEIARIYSEDVVSAQKGGDLGWLSEDAIAKKFTETAFALSSEEIAEPIETSFGFHIIKLLDGPAVVKQPFDSVKGKIAHKLRYRAKEAEMKRLQADKING